MQLCDLPLDVFKVIVTSTVQELGLYDSMNVRFTCRLLASEILDAIITTRVVEDIMKSTGRKMRVLVQPDVIGRYLHHRFSTDGPNPHPWISRIRATTQTLTQKTNSKNHLARIEHFERSACDCLALNRGSKVYEILNGGRDERPMEDGGTAADCLAIAAWIGDLNLVRSLHNDSDKLSLFGRPSWAAAAHGHVEVLLYLLNKGALPYEPHDQDRNLHDVWMSALSTAAYLGRDNIVSTYLQLAYYRLETEADRMFRPILAAVQGNQTSTLRTLLDRYKAHAPPQEYLRTIDFALVQACKRGLADSGGVLLEYGADVHETDGSARTCLQLAAMYGSIPLVKMLLDAGAIDEANNKVRRRAFGTSEPGLYQKGALHIAKRKGFTTIVELLEKKKVERAIA
ncbi:hypothetical protein M3J09_001443 [Ascochyta lentis]